MKLRILLTLMIGGMVMATPAAPAARLYDYEETVLDNGLRVLTLEDDSCPIVAVQVWYHVGSKNERPERQGFAHMFEHMMFRGTDNLGPEQHFSLIRQTGGTCNAFTSFDYTAYVNLLPSNQLDLALWLEAERMLFLKVDEENFHTERQVVIEERRQDLNQPYGTIFEQLMPVVFQKHPYRWLPIGKIPHLMEAKTDELKHFWDKYYVPANATLVIVGDVKHNVAVEKVKEYFGWIPKLPEPAEVTIEEPEQEAPREVTIREGIGPAPLLRYVYRAVPVWHEDFVPLQVLTNVLGDGESSRLYRDLVKEQKLSQEAFAYLWGLEQDGLLMLGAELMPGGDLNAVFEAMDRQVDAVRQEPVLESELAKVKNRLRREAVTETLSDSGKARRIGQTAIQYGSPSWLNEQLDAIESVTPETVLAVAKKYLVPERRTTVRVLPEEGYKYEPASDPTSSISLPDTYLKQDVKRPASFPDKPPMHPLLEELPEPKIRERTLENGLKVVVLPNHEVPFVTIALGLKKGAWTEDPKKPGVASLALGTLTKGTENYTAAELAEAIESNALTLEGSAAFGGQPTMDVGSVTATALSDKAGIAMELLGEVVLRPTFPEEEIDIAKEQLRLELSVKERDSRYLASRELRRRLYGDHPYGRSPKGESGDIDRIAPEDLSAWWKQEARPTDAVLYFAGDIKPRQAWKLAEEYLGAWDPEPASKSPTFPPLPERKDTHIYLVDNPGAVQSEIRLGQLSVTRQDPLYHQARVYAQIYGSGFDSRLNKEIRVKRGLTYAVWGYFDPSLASGEFITATFTKTPTTADTVQGLLEVIRGMATDPPTTEELDGARSYLVGSFAKQLETPQDVLVYQWLIEYANLPSDYLQQALDAYRQTTKEQVELVAREVVDPDKLTIVVVGDAEKIREGLESIAPVTVVAQDAR